MKTALRHYILFTFLLGCFACAGLFLADNGKTFSGDNSGRNDVYFSVNASAVVLSDAPARKRNQNFKGNASRDDGYAFCHDDILQEKFFSETFFYPAGGDWSDKIINLPPSAPRAPPTV
ncbi:MAG: hypothetical protein WC071_10010 [Victivallaceae bacterium]